MGFLDRLRASESLPSEWKELTDESQLETIDQVSREAPVVIFKHSTSCGISAGAKHRLESGSNDMPDEVEFYYLDLLRYRNISNVIADRYHVRHESPQVLIISKGKASYHVSHHRIMSSVIASHLES